jgi:hypothetical protein
MIEILKNYLETEIKVVKTIIEDRSKDYSFEVVEEDLYDIDMDKYPVNQYDQNDSENHNYDMGRLKTLEEILKKIADD